MQFDWMVQCYAGAGVHRDTPMLDTVERETILGGVDAAVETGLEGLWAPDHFMLGPKAEEYEVWTLLGALAERTNDIDIGPLVGSITYRNPALLAKMATTVDILSEGRLQLGLGAGWHEEEHHAYGFEFPDIDTRIEMLEEGTVIEADVDESEFDTGKKEDFEIEVSGNSKRYLKGGGLVLAAVLLSVILLPVAGIFLKITAKFLIPVAILALVAYLLYRRMSESGTV